MIPAKKEGGILYLILEKGIVVPLAFWEMRVALSKSNKIMSSILQKNPIFGHFYQFHLPEKFIE
jgi:hypothetical protein